MKEPLIQFSCVTRRFFSGSDEFEAVRDVNLNIARGEFITVVGPSGCGKSTLLNMTAGVLTPSSGTVTYAGQKVDKLNLKTGYMSQNDHLLPWRTVAKNIAVPLEIRGESRSSINANVRRLIHLVGLTSFENTYPSELSGGMRKRAALARLLAYDPETLLMDEPFAALDAQLRLKMQSELRRLSRQLNKTVIFVTHDLDEAVALADRCVVFSKRPGEITNIVDVALSPDRNVAQLRHDPTYTKLTADLWDVMTPALEEQDA